MGDLGVHKNYKKIGGVAAFLLLGSSVLLFSGSQKEESESLESALFASESTSFIGLSNDYTQFNDDGEPILLDGPSHYAFLEDSQVVEPHRSTTLHVYGNFPDTTKFVWDIKRESPVGIKIDDSSTATEADRIWGRSVQKMFLSSGYNYNVKVTIYASSEIGDNTLALSTPIVLKQKVTCLYVRRELRALHKEDRELLLSAMWIPYSLSMIEGTALYGPEYMDILSINSMHNYWAADFECDHLHDGAGFATQHLSLTLRYEMALQSINPKIALPYWEYTMESAQIVNNHNSNYEKFYDISPVFSNDWFGPFENMKEPWSEIEVTTSTLRFNPFGLVRAPWNFAHETKILRYKQRCGFSTAKMLMDMERPSTCEAFANTLDLGVFEQFQTDLMHSPHGSIHIMLGGIGGGCDVTYKHGLKGHFTDNAIARISQLSAVAVKQMWREGYVAFNQCDLETQEECGQYCTSDDYLEMGNSVWNIFKPWNIDIKDDTNTDYLEALGKVLCSTSLSIGDMYSSSATIDPLFWVMHTTTDRLMTYKRAKDYAFTDTTWHEDTCFGHSPDDELIFDISSFLKGEGTTMTNMDLLIASDPTNLHYGLHAVFDSFSYDHCDYDLYPTFARDYMPSDEELAERAISQDMPWGSGPDDNHNTKEAAPAPKDLSTDEKAPPTVAEAAPAPRISFMG